MSDIKEELAKRASSLRKKEYGNEMGQEEAVDVGTTSYSEKEKGQASDSFKRAVYFAFS
ncbi:hypothetical protein AALD74_21575 [Lachnospiraceae bacterium 48-21]